MSARVPLTRPYPVDWELLGPRLKQVLESGVLTNGPQVRELEQRLSLHIGVQHCVAVTSCTTGIMLVLRALGLQGEVIVPGFTFPATVHAVAWNGLRPVFVDCDPELLTITPETVKASVSEATSAILATHIFGTPCDVDALEDLARGAGVSLIFDAAHALGGQSAGRPVGRFGQAEIFSLTPTKPLVGAEGGIIATDDDDLAEMCRVGRDYGNPGDYDCRFVGLNGRLSELHAALALEGLDRLDYRIIQRNALAERYRQLLADVPDVAFPAVRPYDRSTFKDMTVLLDGTVRDRVAAALAEEGIETRTYYAPPVHLQQAYRNSSSPAHLPVTEDVCRRVLTLPLWSEMTGSQVESVSDALHKAFLGVAGRSGSV